MLFQVALALDRRYPSVTATLDLWRRLLAHDAAVAGGVGRASSTSQAVSVCVRAQNSERRRLVTLGRGRVRDGSDVLIEVGPQSIAPCRARLRRIALPGRWRESDGGHIPWHGYRAERPRAI